MATKPPPHHRRFELRGTSNWSTWAVVLAVLVLILIAGLLLLE